MIEKIFDEMSSEYGHGLPYRDNPYATLPDREGTNPFVPGEGHIPL
jgi:hypothetical protein